MLGTFIASIISSVWVSKNNFEKNYLIENEYYAQKLASTTDNLFSNMLKQLTVTAEESEFLSTDITAINTKLNQLLQGPMYFNSTWFVDHTGKVISSAPKLNLEGTMLSSIGVKEALKQKSPLISEPYIGITGKLIMLISVPVINEEGTYLGFLAGTIHLYEENSLKTILGKHPKHQNDSYVYVVDSKGNIIYHPDAARINDNVQENEVVKQVLQGKSGNQEVRNTKGIQMLAGFAASHGTIQWGIISQTPKKSVWEPTIDVAKQVFYTAIPFMIIGYIFTLILAKKIVNPIRSLAIYARKITKNQVVQIPRIPDWYFELKELKRAILLAVDFFQKKLTFVENESNLDPLTGLYNRRYLEKILNNFEEYSIILFDIDHFKNVNDIYGHQVGDTVLKFLAKIVQHEIRQNDLCFRLGGEEFLILLPTTDLAVAQSVAERIRRVIAKKISPTGKSVTVSMGIGNFPQTGETFSELFKMTDQALYTAKQDGRNKVVVAAKFDKENED